MISCHIEGAVLLARVPQVDGGDGVPNSTISGVCQRGEGGHRVRQCQGHQEIDCQVNIWHQMLHL